MVCVVVLYVVDGLSDGVVVELVHGANSCGWVDGGNVVCG